MVLYLAGEEHSGASDKLTGFQVCSLFLIFCLSASLSHHFPSHHLSLCASTNSDSCGSRRQSGEDGLNPLNTSSALALLSHTHKRLLLNSAHQHISTHTVYYTHEIHLSCIKKSIFQILFFSCSEAVSFPHCRW